VGFLGNVVSKDSGLIKNVDFQGFRMLHLHNLRYVFGTLGNEANIII